MSGLAEFTYAVPGKPATWRRKRLAVQGGKARTFTSREQAAATRAHQWAALAALGSGHAAWSRTGAFAVEVRGYYASAVVGDADRLASLALDALEGVAYVTDRQVRRVTSEVHADGSPERVEVVVRRIAETVQPARRGAAKRAALLAAAESAAACGDAASAERMRAKARLTPPEMRALLAEGREVRRDLEARIAKMRAPSPSDAEKAKAAKPRARRKVA